MQTEVGKFSGAPRLARQKESGLHSDAVQKLGENVFFEMVQEQAGDDDICMTPVHDGPEPTSKYIGSREIPPATIER